MVTYCTNIHPGENWSEVFANLRRQALRVKEAVSPADRFPIGLRLSARAAGEIDAEMSARFRRWCAAHGCFVATVNGFPYGPFHGVPVKEAVYLPDWRSSERVAYTTRLADLLAAWLPTGRRGSIS
ncbi:MAG: xylose isomerase, partial [Proteobacteria bacterium]|nr:xylose isomerase [Pseudomonadota bacterium]